MRSQKNVWLFDETLDDEEIGGIWNLPYALKRRGKPALNRDDFTAGEGRWSKH